ncbi:MAG: hypothetical protein A7316_01610 [Candidatus Altiarchaeales archaeon WOR_SM1_86-2]|nr:MAG: hypothetical protein A7316_01610 [Candidatus Altiarchaeales archaeon WOR_SM1_86-2]
MKLAALFSGGKDSTMALYRALENYDVPVLLSMISERDDSYMYHTSNINLVSYSADAIGIPVVRRKTSGVPPEENSDLRDAVLTLKNDYGIEGVVVGAVHSNYQYNGVSEICRELDLEVYAPYWQHSHEELIRDAINAGFKIIFISVSAECLDETWLGRELNYETLDELMKLEGKSGIDIGGEGGDYETIVLDAPIFKKRVEILEKDVKWDGVRGEWIIRKVRLVDKN